jgi:hypothetical protein
MNKLIIPWFLWSIVYPGGQYRESDIVAQPVKEFRSQGDCEMHKPEYRREVDKAYPNKGAGWRTWPTVELICSPVYPK